MFNATDVTLLCRLCSENSDVNVPIFGEDKNILLKILACLPVKVSLEDNLPKQICCTCLDKLESYHQFRQKAEDTERQLLNWLNQPEQLITDLSSSVEQSECKTVIIKEEVDISGNVDEINSNRQDSIENNNVEKKNNKQTEDEESHDFYEPLPKRRKTSETLQEESKDQEINLKSVMDINPQTKIEDSDDDDLTLDESQALHLELEIEPETSDAVLSSDNVPSQIEGCEVDNLTTDKPEILNIETIDVKNEGLELSTSDDNMPFSQIKNADESKKACEPSNLLLVCIQWIESQQKEECTNIIENESSRIDHTCVSKLPKFSNKEEIKPLHQEERLHRCRTCRQVFLTKHELKIHLPMHKEKSFKCDLCPRSYFNRSRLESHRIVHSKEKKFQCETCGESYKRDTSLKKHIMQQHSGESRLFKCTICNKDYKTNFSLENHIKCDHLNVKHKCDVCEKEFRWLTTLRQHKKTHIKTDCVLRCTMCNKEYENEHSFSNHMKKVHARKFVCHFCGKKLSSYIILQQHIRTHTGEKPFACDTCGKAFTNRNLLTMHIRVHTKEKPFLCGVCGKGFSQAGSVNIHVKTMHTKERTHQCVICKNKFKTQNSLSTHLKRHEIHS